MKAFSRRNVLSCQIKFKMDSITKAFDCAVLMISNDTTIELNDPSTKLKKRGLRGRIFSVYPKLTANLNICSSFSANALML